MNFDQSSDKHRAMRDLLIELSVSNPKNNTYYSTGSTVTEAAIVAALSALRKYKKQVRQAAKSIVNLSSK